MIFLAGVEGCDQITELENKKKLKSNQIKFKTPVCAFEFESI